MTLDQAFAGLPRIRLPLPEPDRHIGELCATYRDSRVTVPSTAFNAVHNLPEAA